MAALIYQTMSAENISQIDASRHITEDGLQIGLLAQSVKGVGSSLIQR